MTIDRTEKKLKLFCDHGESLRSTLGWFRIASRQFSEISTFFKIFDFLTSNIRNWAPVAFLIYKFVWAETLQKVSLCNRVLERNLETGRPRSSEILFFRTGQLACQRSVMAFKLAAEASPPRSTSYVGSPSPELAAGGKPSTWFPPESL